MVSTAQYTVQIFDMSRRPPHQGTKTVEANSPKEAAEVALGFEVKKETGLTMNWSPEFRSSGVATRLNSRIFFAPRSEQISWLVTQRPPGPQPRPAQHQLPKGAPPRSRQAQSGTREAYQTASRANAVTAVSISALLRTGVAKRVKASGPG